MENGKRETAWESHIRIISRFPFLILRFVIPGTNADRHLLC